MTYALYYDIYSIVDLRPGFKRKAHYFFDRSGTTRSEYTIILSYRVPADASNVTLFPYDIVIVAPWSRSGNLKYCNREICFTRDICINRFLDIIFHLH